MKHQLGISTVVVRILAPLLILASAFPYVQIVPSSSYTQPYAFLLGLVLFFFSFSTLVQLRSSDQIAIFSLGFVGVVLYLTTCIPYDNVQEYQYLLAYLSPLLLVPCFILAIQKNTKQTILLLQSGIVIWLLISATQFFVHPEFATSLLGDWGGSAADIISSGRGVLGLAPEPTHHAFHILLLGAGLALLDSSRLSCFLILGCMVSAVIFAASSSAALVLLVAILIWLLRYKTLWGLMLIFVALSFLSSAALISQLVFDGDGRMFNLIKDAFENPTTFLIMDQSVNTRLGGLWVVLNDTIRGGLMPNGLSHDTWLQARIGILSTYDWLFDLSMSGPPSGFGMLIFQGGVLVTPFLIMFLRRLFMNQSKALLGQVIVITVPFIFLSQFYISSPLFSMIYACALYRLSLKRIGLRHKYLSFQKAS